MTLSWSERYERRKEIQARFGDIHRLPLVRRVHHLVAGVAKEGDTLLDVGSGYRKLEAALQRRGVPHAREQLGEELDRAVETPQRLGREPDPPEAKTVEQILEAVGERAKRVEAEEPGEALERVRGAEEPVHELGRRLDAVGASIGEIGQILAHALEDLLGLRDELTLRLAARTPPNGSPRQLQSFRARSSRSSTMRWRSAGSKGFTT